MSGSLEAAEAPARKPEQALYSVTEACVYLGGISRGTLFKLIQAGFPSVRQGRRVYVTRKALDNYVESLEKMSFDNQ